MSPHGAYVMTRSRDHAAYRLNIKLLEVTTAGGECATSSLTASADQDLVTWHPTQDSLVVTAAVDTSGRDLRLYMHDLKGREEPVLVPGFTTSTVCCGYPRIAWCCAWAPDGSHLACAWLQVAPRLWNPGTAYGLEITITARAEGAVQHQRTPAGPGDYFNKLGDMQLSSQGLLAIMATGTLVVYSPDLQQEISRNDLGSGFLTSLLPFSPGGHFLFARASNELWFFDTSTWELVPKPSALNAPCDSIFIAWGQSGLRTICELNSYTLRPNVQKECFVLDWTPGHNERLQQM